VKTFQNFDSIRPNGGRKYKWGVKNSQLSTNKLPYIWNGAL